MCDSLDLLARVWRLIGLTFLWGGFRSYKNGYVWHDLGEDDFIHPAHGNEYVLKGSELLLPITISASQDTSASSSSFSSSGFEKPLEIHRSAHDDSGLALAAAARRKKPTPWSSMDLGEYKVYKTEATAEAAARAAADAATQTEEKRLPRGRRGPPRGEDRAEAPSAAAEDEGAAAAELGSDEISPPPSSSSPETLETLIKADGRSIVAAPAAAADRTVGSFAMGRMRASAVLMHLISCGSISVKEHGSVVVPRGRDVLTRGQSDLSGKDLDRLVENPGFTGLDKEYFSGSLVETKKTVSEGAAEFPGLKRSSSYNADR